MRADPCTFAAILQSLTPTQWERVYGAARSTTRRWLASSLTQRGDVVSGYFSGLTISEGKPFLSGDDHDLVIDSIIYLQKQRALRTWTIGRVVDLILRKTNFLIIDAVRASAKAKKEGLKQFPMMDNAVPPLNDAEKLNLALEIERLLVRTTSVYKNDAIRLMWYCVLCGGFKESATTRFSFQPAEICPALGWEPDHFQNVRRFLMSFRCLESEFQGIVPHIPLPTRAKGV